MKIQIEISINGMVVTDKIPLQVNEGDVIHIELPINLTLDEKYKEYEHGGIILTAERILID